MSKASQKWLLDQWAAENARTLESMSDAKPAAGCSLLLEVPEFEPGTIFLEVTLSLDPNNPVWIAVPPESVAALGQRTLQAAGIDDAGPEELQNTCLEILQQAHAGLAQAISARLRRAVTSKGREIDSIASPGPFFQLDITYPDQAPIPTYLAFAPGLPSQLEPPASEPEPKPAAPIPVEERAPPPVTSKTFDILLDVSMPVSVSFGRTEMPIKEVLKLTTGSIVELNRNLTEPVEVIVNDRVIARGEVVVVDGNYGVRIHNIVSKQERFRSTAPAAAMIAKSEIRA